jgi:hypothetical protein
VKRPSTPSTARRPWSAPLVLGAWLSAIGCGSTTPSPDAAVPGPADAATEAAAPPPPTADAAAEAADAPAPPASCGASPGGGVWAAWPMPDATRGYDLSTPGIAVDRVTGLGWQRVLSPELHDWAGARATCDCLTLGGYDDWRLPTRIELVSLVDFTRQDPALDPQAFPDTPFEWFWTASPRAESDPPAAWYVAFFDGDTHHASVDVPYHVRCVRGGAAAAKPSYTIQADGTVADGRTRLTWQRAVEPVQRTWKDAATYCRGLPLAGGGWRLPDVKELQTLIDESRRGPAIDPQVFPETPAEGFWTSPPLAGMPTFAWFVSFDGGIAYNSNEEHLYNVRCVR